MLDRKSLIPVVDTTHNRVSTLILLCFNKSGKMFTLKKRPTKPNRQNIHSGTEKSKNPHAVKMSIIYFEIYGISPL